MDSKMSDLILIKSYHLLLIKGSAQTESHLNHISKCLGTGIIVEFLSF